eukprot:11214307-Lingulodinium_polyedra.AAC.1
MAPGLAQLVHDPRLLKRRATRGRALAQCAENAGQTRNTAATLRPGPDANAAICPAIHDRETRHTSVLSGQD